MSRVRVVTTSTEGESRSRSRRVGMVVLVTLVVLAASATAAWAAPEPAGVAQVQRFASRLAHYVTLVAASIAVLFVAINGVRYAASNGNPSKQLDAKNGLVSAGVGLAVALSADLLVQLVVAALR